MGCCARRRATALPPGFSQPILSDPLAGDSGVGRVGFWSRDIFPTTSEATGPQGRRLGPARRGGILIL